MKAAQPSNSGATRVPADFFAETVRQLYAVPIADTALELRGAWDGFGIVAAGAELLAGIGYPEHVMLMRGAAPLLEESTRALRGAASLPEGTAPVEVIAEGTLGGDPGPDLIYVIHRGVYEVTLALASLLRQAMRHADDVADRRACRQSLVLAQALGRVYAIRPRISARDRAAHPVYFPASDAAEMARVIHDHSRAVRESDPADSQGVLTAVWYALGVAACLAQFLARRDPDAAIPGGPTGSAIADAITALASAPSMPADIHGVGLRTTEPSEADPCLMNSARDGVQTLADVSRAALESAAELLTDRRDRSAAAAAARAAVDLAAIFRPPTR